MIRNIKFFATIVIGLIIFFVLLKALEKPNNYFPNNTLKKIDESKYKVSGVTILRNEHNELISVIRVDATRYLDDPIIDKFLKSDPKYLVKQGIVNDEKISLYRVQVDYSPEKCSTKMLQIQEFNNECNFYDRSFVTMLGITDSKGEQHFAFKGLNHVYTLKPSDKITTIWDILTKD